MSGRGADASPLLAMVEQVATLRHDLVNPIGLIVGYCELLIAEAGDHDWSAIVAPLGSIRRIGFVLLGKIDRVLLHDAATRTVDDLRRLGEEMLGPALLLVQEADALLGQVAGIGRGTELAEDLDKIRAAGAYLVVLIESLESPTVADA